MFLRAFLRRVRALVSQTKGTTLLDVGCAEGFALHYIQRYNPGLHTVGIDNDPNAITRGQTLFPHMQLHVGNGLHIAAAERSYDIVLALEILEHVTEPEQLLQEIRRVSKKHCIVSVPREPWFCLANLARGKNVSRWGNDPDHIHRWNTKKFETMLRNNGFRIVKRKLPFPWQLYLCEV